MFEFVCCEDRNTKLQHVAKLFLEDPYPGVGVGGSLANSLFTPSLLFELISWKELDPYSECDAVFFFFLKEHSYALKSG